MTKQFYFTYILLLLFSFRSVSQFTTSSLIKKLNDSQFTILHAQKATFTFKDQPALKLIKKGTSASNKLFIALSDSTKTIMAHLVLCNIYFKIATFAGPVIVTENDKHISKYFLGKKDGEGLMISEAKTNDTYKTYVMPEDRRIIIGYWKNKLKK
ncbi:MAG: hypothetical protein H0W73_03400 [Bacteroidetes bacterium]|nr:hypothetical protein [Bacteroidota bacterium]